MGYKYFVDREAELSALMSFIGNGVKLLYLYGPRGIGTSSLLQRFGKSLRVFDNYVVIYVDSIEGDRVEYALIASKNVEEILRRLAMASEMPPGRALLYSLPVVLVRLGLFSIVGKHVVIIVDHVDRGIGPGRVHDYLDSLSSVANKLLTWRATSVTIIGAGTQLGLNTLSTYKQGKVLVQRVSGLPLPAYAQLVKNLGVDAEPEKLWELTGGNPGETIIIATRYKGDIDFWMKALAARLRKVVKIIENKGLLGELSKAVHDISTVSDDLIKTLQAYDLVIRADTPILGGKEGTRRVWAWSLPVYREILSEIVQGKA